MDHLRRDEIQDFAAGRLKAADRQRIVRHLLSGCATCCRKLLLSEPELFLEEDSPLIGDESSRFYDRAIDRALASVGKHEEKWQGEKQKREETFTSLRRTVEAEPLGLSGWEVHGSSGWPLAEALLQLSFEARFRSPVQMLQLARQARLVAESTDPELYSPGIVSDLRARIWAELANAYRVNTKFGEADRAIQKAHEYLEEGTGDLGLLARVLNVEGCIRKDQYKLPEALDLLARAQEFYLQLGESHLAARMLVSRGITSHDAGDPAEAVRCLEQAIPMLDRGRDPQLVAIAQQALSHALLENGEYRRASELLLESGIRQAFAAQPLNLLRLRWLEGKIHAGLDRLDRAEQILQEVRKGFKERNLEYSAALVGLDLASVWLRQGKLEPVRGLAEKMIDTFRSLKIDKHAIRALLLLQKASNPL